MHDKVKNMHTEYIIIIALSLQQCLKKVPHCYAIRAMLVVLEYFWKVLVGEHSR